MAVTKKFYIFNNISREAVNPYVLNEYLYSIICNEELSDETRNFINDFKSDGEDIADHALIGLYRNDYVIAFLNSIKIRTCAIRITHNQNERTMFRKFYKIAENNKAILRNLYIICCKIAIGYVIRRAFNDLETYGMLIDFLPNETMPIDRYISYIDKKEACRIANANAISLITTCFEKGCSIEEITNIVPNDVESRFFNRDWNDFEIMQIEALQPRISDLV